MARYIDAEALNNRINAEWAKQVDDTKGCYGLAHFFVETQPTADVAPVVHAHWILRREPNGEPYCFSCSNCDHDTKSGQNYCERCGAKMDG